MKVAIIIQARLRSSRLPRKILAPLGGMTMLEQVVRRCRAARGISAVAVAVPPEDEMPIFHATGIAPYVGPEEDVLTRLLDAAHALKVDAFVRVTADCPFACPRMIEAMAGHIRMGKEPCVVNWKHRRFPNGLDLEVYSVPWLEQIAAELKGPDREWYAAWIVKNRPASEVASVVNVSDLSRYRLTVDYEEDLDLARRIYRAMGNEVWDSQQIVAWLEARPSLRKINAKYNLETGARPV
jgi:spore coat polysaccharide biosynthesis protein SpsF